MGFAWWKIKQNNNNNYTDNRNKNSEKDNELVWGDKYYTKINLDLQPTEIKKI